MAARLALALLASAVACAGGQQFSTTLHGAPTEVIEPGTAGAATLTLQPWLTVYDADVRAFRFSHPACAARTRALLLTGRLALAAESAARGMVGVLHARLTSARLTPLSAGRLQRRLPRWLLLEAGRHWHAPVAGLPRGAAFRACSGGAPLTSFLHLQGGYWCWDGPSCTERYATDKFDMSSSGWKSLFAQEGIFGTDIDTNPWANANMVFVKVRSGLRPSHSPVTHTYARLQYCSSDSCAFIMRWPARI